MEVLKRFEHRIIGSYGPKKSEILFIILSAIHGNELAGVEALKYVFDYFNRNKININARVVGIKGNVRALEQNVRYLHRDLNRQWYPAKVKKVEALPFSFLNNSEDIEQKEILIIIKELIKSQRNRNICLIDIHTTSAVGSCFTITNSHPKSIGFAKMIGVPVIEGITPQIKGTTLEYFDNLSLPAVAFEAGQHVDPSSIDNVKVALFSIFQKSGILKSFSLNGLQQHADYLNGIIKGLPKVVRIIYRHRVEDEDNFKMKLGYSNFQAITAGEHLAEDRKGNIHSPTDGLILMPLYQEKGSDGFFIVEIIE